MVPLKFSATGASRFAPPRVMRTHGGGSIFQYASYSTTARGVERPLERGGSSRAARLALSPIGDPGRLQ